MQGMHLSTHFKTPDMHSFIHSFKILVMQSFIPSKTVDRYAFII